MKTLLPVAIFYQASEPPAFNGIKKPYKQGGYSDSGADIGFALKQRSIPLITPTENPDSTNNFDWVFPDTKKGFTEAYQRGARIFWLNTVLYASHPVTTLPYDDVRFVGQRANEVEKFDDKFQTNKLLRELGLPISNSILVSNPEDNNLTFPLVLKPIRGRGSQGVVICKDDYSLKTNLKSLLDSTLYGNEFILEEMLPGDEITITVMPPGQYELQGQSVEKKEHWCLPPVKRFNHVDGIAPYNGVVAVVKNSKALLEPEQTKEIRVAMKACSKAAKAVDALAPIRIDCRQDAKGNFKLFDLNLKPNLTGSGRPGRDDQDGLLLMSAKAIGWDYPDLLFNMLNQAWKP